MSKFRNIFFNTGKGIATAIPIKLLQRSSDAKVIFPFYHIVSDVKEPHISHLYAYKNISKFEQDIDFLLKNYKPLNLAEVKDFCHTPEQYKSPGFFLTFDDGLRSFYDVVAPVLRKKGVPAACFLNSDFIDNKSLFFRYKASLLIDKLKSGNSRKNTLNEINFKFEKNGFQNKSIIENLLEVKYNRTFLLDEMAALLDVDFDKFLKIEKPYFTTEQVEELKEQGFYFGAHSIDHPEYRFIDFGEQLRQTETSIKIIQQKFSLPYKIFSFPFTDYGVSNAFLKKVFDEEIADITFGCAGIKPEKYSHHIQRVSMEHEALSAEQIIKTELLYGLARRAVGKHKIIRS